MRVICGLLSLILVLLAVGCAPATPAVPDFSYADGAFSATVHGAFVRTAADGYAGDAALVGDTRTEVRQAVAARVEVGAPVAEGARELRVTFTEPSVLAGVSVVQEAGTGTVTFLWPCPSAASALAVADAEGMLSLPAAGAKPLLRFAEALLPGGDIEKITPVLHGGATVERRSRDGDFAVIFTFSADVDRSLPTHVVVTTPAERLELYVD